MPSIVVTVTLTLDADNAAHRALAKWQECASNDDLVRCMMIGQSVVHNKLHVTSDDDALQELRMQHARDLEIKNDVIDRMQSTLQAVSSKVDKDVEARTRQMNDSYKEQLKVMRESMSAHEGALGTVLNEHVAGLRRELMQKEAELNMFKASNHGKGVMGEQLLMRIIEDIFPRYLVEHKGRVGHESDIHIVNARNEVILVESKFKDRITAADVDKFYRDIVEVGNASSVIGGAFICIRSKNIPGKGSLAFEMRNQVPILFIVFEDEAAAERGLPRHMLVFENVCNTVRGMLNVDTKAASRLAALVQQLSAPLAVIKRNRTRIERLRAEHMVAMNKIILELERDNFELLQLVEKMVASQHEQQPAAEVRARGAQALSVKAAGPACSKCSRTFKSAVGLARHVASCGKAKAAPEEMSAKRARRGMSASD